MEHIDKTNAINHIRPNAEFILRGDDLEWLDTEQTEPTKKEIEDGLVAYKVALQSELDTKESARQALLDRLGITQEEAKLLLS